jgi:hypothetical protein
MRPCGPCQNGIDNKVELIYNVKKDWHFMAKLVPIESIISKIVFLRDEKVILDRDLAELYGVETKQLKRAVRRNINRFPEDFMFQLSKEEYQSLRSQFDTLKRGAHAKYPPMAFTEQGVAMLSITLNSERAIQANIPNSRSDDWFQFSKPAPLNFSEKRSEANLTRVAELKCLCPSACVCG